MAKLSEQKKVELLENVVLNETVEKVSRVIEEWGPFEFTARALGYAARFRGAEMVKCLLDHGATFAYDPVPAFVKKYTTKVKISNLYNYNVDYSLYLLKDQKIDPVPENAHIIDDEERGKVLVLLHTEAQKAVINETEVLYYSILYGDTAIRESCAKVGINRLSDERTANIRCDTNYAHMDGLQRHFRDEFTWTLRRATANHFKGVLMDILPLLGEKQMQMMPADLYYDFFTGKKDFIGHYCAEGLFELVVKHTNLIERVKKWDVIYALVDQNNATGLNYALERNWISKPKDYITLLEYVQSRAGLNAELLDMVMQYVEKNVPRTASMKKGKTPLDTDPFSSTSRKKDWNVKEKEDGTLVITSYKGTAADIYIPETIGGKMVTEIGEKAFSPQKSRITKLQAEYREKITSVIISEGIARIGAGAFDGCKSLSEVHIPKTVTEICQRAFCGCNLTDITIPETVKEIGWRAFSANDYLGHAEKLTIHGKPDSAAHEYAQGYYANFVAEE